MRKSAPLANTPSSLSTITHLSKPIEKATYNASPQITKPNARNINKEDNKVSITDSTCSLPPIHQYWYSFASDNAKYTLTKHDSIDVSQSETASPKGKLKRLSKDFQRQSLNSLPNAGSNNNYNEYKQSKQRWWANKKHISHTDHILKLGRELDKTKIAIKLKDMKLSPLGASPGEEACLKSKAINIANKGFSCTQVGRRSNGENKINQDSVIVLNNLLNLNFNIYGVWDGHGPNGHLVSQFVQQRTQSYFVGLPQFKKKTNLNESSVYKILSDKNCEIVKRCFHSINKELSKQEYDTAFSGTTCNMILQIGKHIISANIGDSRSMIFRAVRSKGGKTRYVGEDISIDHKPNLDQEKKRIEQSGGEVIQDDDDSTFRVYVKTRKYPGIAISRSLGDFIAKSVGVCADADIVQKQIEYDSKFVILASDGVWDYLSGDDITTIVTPFYYKKDPAGAAASIVEEAKKIWDEYNDERDDITAIVAFIDTENRYFLNKKLMC